MCYVGEKVGFDAYPWGQFPLGTRMSFGPVRREFSEYVEFAGTLREF